MRFLSYHLKSALILLESNKYMAEGEVMVQIPVICLLVLAKSTADFLCLREKISHELGLGSAV